MNRTRWCALALLLAACGSKTQPSSESSKAAALSARPSATGATPTATLNGSPASSAAVVKAPPSKPGVGFVDPPLGPPDAIEPPSRDFIPGMTVADALAKGAKPVQGNDVKLRAGPHLILDFDNGLRVVTTLEVEYGSAAEFEALKAKWGKPAIGEETWNGANWQVWLSSGGDNPVVFFTRAPYSFFPKKPVPPGVLANLRRGMTAAEVEKATGLPLVSEFRRENGFGMAVAAWMVQGLDHFQDVSLDPNIGSNEEMHLAKLKELWGPPTDLNGVKVWLDAKDGWMAKTGVGGGFVHFVPMIPIDDLLAKTGPNSILGLESSLLGKPKAVLDKTPGYDAEKFFYYAACANELSTSPPEIAFVLDKDVVTRVDAAIYVDNEADRDKLLKRIETAWGALGPEPAEGFKSRIIGNAKLTVDPPEVNKLELRFSLKDG